MKHALILSVLLGLFAGGAVLAQTEEETELVTLEDLGVENPGLLPTSPFYFVKELGRGIQSFFAFNSVAKAELEERFSNEKAAELKVLEEGNPDDETGIARAIANFERSQERLASRLESLRETSENPNIDRLLENVANRAVLHEKLFQEISERHGEKPAVAARVLAIEAKIADVVRKAAEKDDPARFAERVQNALDEGRGQLRDLRAVEILDRISESVGGEAKERLNDVRENLQERLSVRIEALAEEGQERLQSLLETVPGDKARRSVILEGIRVRSSDAVAGALERVQNTLEARISESGTTQEKASMQIRAATDVVEKAKMAVREAGEVREAVQDLVEQADRHLEAAKAAFAIDEYGEAFGQARAAEVVARNALRILETGEAAPPALQRIQERVNILVPEPRPASDVVCTQEFKPVCGVDGNTYPNACVAQRQNGVRISHEGECRKEGETSGMNIRLEIEADRLNAATDSLQSSQ